MKWLFTVSAGQLVNNKWLDWPAQSRDLHLGLTGVLKTIQDKTFSKFNNDMLAERLFVQKLMKRMQRVLWMNTEVIKLKTDALNMQQIPVQLTEACFCI